MFLKKNGWNKLVVFLMVFSMLFSFGSIVPSGIADAAEYSVTVKIDGTEVKTLSWEELDALPKERCTYSTINTWPTKNWYVGEGPTLADVLDAAGLGIEGFKVIRFKARDGLSMPFTVKELFEDTRCYYPKLKENHEYFGEVPGLPDGAQEVPVILALQKADTDDFADMGDKDTPLLLFGQRWVTEQTNQSFVKLVGEIDLLTADPEKWVNPTASPAPGLVPVGTQVRLSCQYMDADKIYYTTDGTDPTYQSPMYNWIASRWWNNRQGELDEINKPIEITADTTIKAVTIGIGKADSDIVTFEYQVFVPAPAPALTADSTDNLVGNPIELTFTDDETWRGAITGVSVNDIALVSDDYTLTAGHLTLAAGVFAAAGDYSIKIVAAGYEDATVMQTVLPAPPVFTVKINDVEVASYTLSEIKAMPAVNKAYGETGYYVRTGVDFLSLLDSLEIDYNNWPIKLIATDFPSGINLNFSSLIEPLLAYEETEGDDPTVSLLPLKLYHGDGSNHKQVYQNVIGINAAKPEPIAPPALTADSTDNLVGNPIELTFTDDEAWRDAITGVTVNGEAIAGEDYTLAAGRLTLAAGVFAAAGDYSIKIVAAGYEDATVTQVVIPSGGTTWYVGTSDTDDFATIQAAVDAADAWDTIIVKNGTYTENLLVEKSLVIKSENGSKQTTVLAAATNADVFQVTAKNVTIDGFTVSGATSTGKSGINISGDGFCTITNNLCSGSSHGINISADNNTVSDNTCTQGGRYGIHLTIATGNKITNNTCINNTDGSGFALYLADNANNNTVCGNLSDSNTYGIRVKNAYDNTIYNNAISNNEYGLELATKSTGNVFYLNNFINNVAALSAGFQGIAGNFWSSPTEIAYSYKGASYNSMLGNYWSDYAGMDADNDGIGDTPYPTIQTDSDNYPLVNQWEDGIIAVPQIALSCTSGIPGLTAFITGRLFEANSAGTIWFDINDNGVLDEGEPSVAVETDARGTIPLLTSLIVPSAATGDYTVRADIGGIKTTADFTITDSGIIATETCGNTQIGPRFDIVGSGFTPGTKYRLFCDRNGNGIFDDGTSKSITIAADGTFKSANQSWPSSPTGVYNFLLDLDSSNVIEACASVCIIPGIKITTPKGAPGITIGATYGGFEANVEGYIWFDANGNGIWDAEENRTDVSTTNAGTINTPISPPLVVPVVGPGNYQVCAAIPARGLKASSTYSIRGMVLNPSSGTAGTEIEIRGFAYENNQVAGKYVWFDTNGNGTWEEGESRVDASSDAIGTLSPVSLIVPDAPAGDYNVRTNVAPSSFLAVFTHQGSPTPLAYDVTFAATPEGVSIEVEDSSGNTVEPEGDGTYKLEAGDYTYKATKQGYQETSGAFTVEDEDLTVNVALEKEAPRYKVIPVDDAVYTIGETPDGIKTMTVNQNQTGLKYFKVSVEMIIAHEGTETVVFTHLRNGAQLGLNALVADFDNIDAAQAGFNVNPGDVIKVFVVDKLTNESDSNPTMLQ